MVKETQAQRLDRIEDKIDKLSDAMVSLARVEKLIAIEKNNHSAVERMNRFKVGQPTLRKRWMRTLTPWV